MAPPSVDPTKRILVYRVPKGVVGVITPWNWPYTMPAEVIAPALAAGNAVVWNPFGAVMSAAAQLEWWTPSRSTPQIDWSPHAPITYGTINPS